MSDLISRQAAIDVVNAICERCGKYKEYNGVMCGACALDGVEDSIGELPCAEPKKGKWIDGHCSVCGCDVPAYIVDCKWQKDMNARFCPMCGADMRESE